MVRSRDDKVFSGFVFDMVDVEGIRREGSRGGQNQRKERQISAEFACVNSISVACWPKRSENCELDIPHGVNELLMALSKADWHRVFGGSHPGMECTRLDKRQPKTNNRKPPNFALHHVDINNAYDKNSRFEVIISTMFSSTRYRLCLITARTSHLIPRATYSSIPPRLPENPIPANDPNPPKKIPNVSETN